jgi:hypothetical protein
MTSKIFGYIIALVGLVGLANSIIPEVGILPQQFTGTIPMIASLVITLVGIVLIMKGSSGKRTREVPIYEGKEVIGYRRHRR